MSEPDAAGFVRWPYRRHRWPLPEGCPRCGRPLAVRSWFSNLDLPGQGPMRYFYLSCNGFLPTWLTDWLTAWPEKGHWRLAIGAWSDGAYFLTAPDAVAIIERGTL